MIIEIELSCIQQSAYISSLLVLQNDVYIGWFVSVQNETNSQNKINQPKS